VHRLALNYTECQSRICTLTDESIFGQGRELPEQESARMSESDQAKNISALASETRRFSPDPAMASRANAQAGIYEQAQCDPEAYWASWARRLTWQRPFTKVLDWQAPFARWFYDGTLNASVNALDRHVTAGKGDRVAFYFEGEPGDRKAITYTELLKDVCRFANGLRRLGIRKGDRVAIYLPMTIELPIAMLACARIGAVHSVVFGGFSADAIADRVNDSGCVALITADGGFRRGTATGLKSIADEAMKATPSLRHCIVAKRTQQPITMQADRDVAWDDVVSGMPDTCEPEEMNAEDLLFLLYTSGTTAKPKGIMHSTAGYLTGAMLTHKLVFDYHDEDIYWCAADIGWITGHSYILYVPLCNGATSVLYEGAPDFPERDRWWQIIERYKVSILYTAPTAIRTFMKWGTEHLKKHDLSSLRLLGSVGEPINPEAWMWYRENVGGNQCPIVDTWWQTETGSLMIAPLPGLTTTLPGSATHCLPGIDADIVNDKGETLSEGGGYLVIRKPWPSMLRGIWGDPERYRETYWSRFPGLYLAGDAAQRDAEGNFWFMGRIDDVMNISGHRISTTEVESALVEDSRVAEAAVVGKNDDITGQAICAFVSLRSGSNGTPQLAEELRAHIATRLGKFTKPKYIMFSQELPKTRSGKIMRRLLRDLVEGRALGDTTTLADAGVMNDIATLAQEERDKNPE
jgi:acetyl-CoA synthetase